MRRKQPIRSIAVFRALQLGDLLCAVPSFRALRKRYPQAHIALIGLPWAKDFVRRFSAYLDELIAFPGWPGLPEQTPQLEKIPAFLEQMQQRRFELVIQMQGSGYLTNPLVALFGARQVAGYYLPGQFRPNEATCFPYPEGAHEIQTFLQLMEKLGAPAQGEALEFPVTSEEQRDFEQLKSEHGIRPQSYVCLHPGARALERRWPTEKFAAVGDALSRLGYPVVLTGSQSERALTRAVAGAMEWPALDLAGKTNLGVLALLLLQARLLVSNDTGVSHLAAAVNAPSVVLFNTTDPGRWGPRDEDLHRVILNALEAGPQQVLDQAEILLNEVSSYAA